MRVRCENDGLFVEGDLLRFTGYESKSNHVRGIIVCTNYTV